VRGRSSIRISSAVAVAVGMVALTACGNDSGAPAHTTEVAIARGVAASFPTAPGPVEVYCEWNQGGDSSSVPCYPVVAVSAAAAGAETLSRSVASANHAALDLPALPSVDGRNIVLGLPLTVGQIVGDRVQLVAWTCRDPSVEQRLASGDESVPAASEVAQCVYGPIPTFFDRADRLPIT
jgi:hypothetical protein